MTLYLLWVPFQNLSQQINVGCFGFSLGVNAWPFLKTLLGNNLVNQSMFNSLLLNLLWRQMFWNFYFVFICSCVALHRAVIPEKQHAHSKRVVSVSCPYAGI